MTRYNQSAESDIEEPSSYVTFTTRRHSCTFCGTYRTRIIKETARLTDERLELSDEVIMKLNDQLNIIRDNIGGKRTGNMDDLFRA